jgi:glycosyltransferase involved in cell wall biosynthesis
MKILFVLPEYYPHPGGGMATFNMGFVDGLVKRGIRADVLLGSAVMVGNKQYTHEGVTIRELKSELLRKYKDKFKKFCMFPELQNHIAASWAMWEQAQQGVGYDVVETTDWGLGGIPWIIKDSAPPTIVQMHGSTGQIETYDPRPGLELQSDIVRMIELNLFSAAAVLDSYSAKNQSYWEKILGREVLCSPPPYKLNLNPLSRAPEQDTGVVVGRVQHWKGPAVLCEALKILKDKAPKIAWIGRDMNCQEDGKSMSAHLKKRYAGIWGIKIKSLGQLPYEETQKYIAKAKFGFFSSLWDTFNFTCPEFMGQGKVVICSRGAGASDMIEDGINGFTFDPEKSEELAELILKVQALSEHEMAKIGEAARETIKNVLCPVKFVDARIKLYESLMRGHYKKRPVSRWLSDFLSPSDSGENFSKILDQIPLRKIGKYFLSRGLRKFSQNG